MKRDKSELIQTGDMYKVLLSLSIPIMINSVIAPVCPIDAGKPTPSKIALYIGVIGGVFIFIFNKQIVTKYSMAMEVGRLWIVRLPMILIFKNYSDLGPTGIWFSMSFSNFIVCLFGLWVYKTHGWDRKTIDSIIVS